MIKLPSAVSMAAKRQLDTTGHTSMNGGLFTKKFVVESLLSGTNLYFTKREPTGKYMSEISEKPAELEKVADAISKSARAMQTAATDSLKLINDVSAKTRDSTDKLSAAIDKFMKIATRPDFQQKLDSVESMVGALERLAKLEERGLLGRVFTTLGK